MNWFSLDSLNATIHEFSVSRGEIRELLVNLNTTIANFPDFSIIRSEFEKIDVIYEAVDCVDSLLSHMRFLSFLSLSNPAWTHNQIQNKIQKFYIEYWCDIVYFFKKLGLLTKQS